MNRGQGLVPDRIRAVTGKLAFELQRKTGFIANSARSFMVVVMTTMIVNVNDDDPGRW
jgi:hypothetical protein